VAALVTREEARKENRMFAKFLVAVMVVLMVISVLTILITHHYYLG